MENSPFSFYDFLGYLFPGAITLFFISFFYIIGYNTSFIEYFNIQLFIENISSFIDDNSLLSITLIVLFSYVIGHIISFLSSCTVEYFSNSLLDYPSKYLMDTTSKSFTDYLKKYFDYTKTMILLWRIIILLLLFPVSLIIVLFGHLLNINEYITRPFDKYAIKNIGIKQNKLLAKLKLSDDAGNFEEVDIHSLIMYYVYLNIADRRKKADNYIALYGFLRSLTLILCVITIYLSSVLIFISDFKMGNICIILIMILLCNILFMAFVKIYRRFTKEDYITLLTYRI